MTACVGVTPITCCARTGAAASATSAVELMMNFNIGVVSSKNIDLRVRPGCGALDRRYGSEGSNRVKRRRTVHVIVASSHIGRAPRVLRIKNLIQRAVEAIESQTRWLIPPQTGPDRGARPKTAYASSGSPIQIYGHRVVIPNEDDVMERSCRCARGLQRRRTPAVSIENRAGRIPVKARVS